MPDVVSLAAELRGRAGKGGAREQSPRRPHSRGHLRQQARAGDDRARRRGAAEASAPAGLHGARLRDRRRRRAGSGCCRARCSTIRSPASRCTSTSCASAPRRSIHVEVEVTFANEDKSPGLKKGGVLNIVHHTLTWSARPDAIPEMRDRRSRRPGAGRRRPCRTRSACPKASSSARTTRRPPSPASPRRRPRRSPSRPRRRKRPRKPRRPPEPGRFARVGGRRPWRPSGCCSPASAIPGRSTPATGTTSASWRSTRSFAATGSARSRTPRFTARSPPGGSPAARRWRSKPATFMNESGRSVAEAARFYKIPPGGRLRLPRRARPRRRQGAGEAGRRRRRPQRPAQHRRAPRHRLLARAPRHRPSGRQAPGAGPRARRFRRSRPPLARPAAGRRSAEQAPLLVAGDAAGVRQQGGAARSIRRGPPHPIPLPAGEASRRRRRRRPGRASDRRSTLSRRERVRARASG